MPPPGPILSVRDLSVHFGGVRALDGVSLELDVDETVGVIGPNGSGKTTLFDTISGLTAPTGGRLLLGGTDHTTTSAVARARWGLRRTFQRQQVFGRLSVEDNLLSALEWEGGGGTMAADLLRLPGRTARERVRRAEVAETLEWCGLTEHRHTLAATLPIGTARLVELGRAIVARPRVLLLDEATSGLGASEAASFTAALATYRERHRCAVLLVEHDMAFVMARSSRIYVLTSGRVLAEGTPAEVQHHPEVIAAYLG